MSFLVEPQNQGRRVSWLSLKSKVDRFFGLGLKTGSCSLVIWASKSPQWFLGLSFKLSWQWSISCATKLTGGGRPNLLGSYL
jgi:hypothetical protein